MKALSLPRQPLAILIGRYLFTLALLAGTLGGLSLFRNWLSISIVALVFLLSVGISTALWGLGPGVFAAMGAFLILNYFFISPYYTLQVHQTQDLIALGIFMVVAFFVNQLVGRTQASLAEARARERDTALLSELSLALARLNDDQAIARALAEQIWMTFQAQRVQVSIEMPGGVDPQVLCAPEGASYGEDRPVLLVPLQTARGILGEIGVWRAGWPAMPVEERLLRAFANQGVLALERARLAQADRRAQVLEESDKLKSALLSSVSHELRTPLATIKASVTSLLSEEVAWDTEARRDLLSAVEDETDHLNRLVGNLLDMSRLEAGAIRPQRKWNVLAEIAAGAVHQMRSELSQHQVSNEISEDLPLVPVDYMQMERVFSNLLSNSIKYSPPGTQIRFQAEASEGGVVRVRVINRGPHVPEEHLERIFDKFYRVTAADRVTGTGLGLSICKGFVEAHGGRIWAENLPTGFAFNFTLPLTWEGGPLRLPMEL